jgi:hypothetical protein
MKGTKPLMMDLMAKLICTRELLRHKSPTIALSSKVSYMNPPFVNHELT